MGIYDFCCYSKAKSGSLGLICNKWTKDILHLCLSHSTAVILYRYTDAAICFIKVYRNLSFGMINGFTGISYQIKYNLTHFYTVK